MKSEAPTVEAYLAMVAEARRPVLTALRELCLTELPDFVEAMVYGMPTYSRDRTPEVAWASQQRYISLYILRSDVLDAHRGDLPGLSIGKGCVRFARPEQVAFPLIATMLRETASLPGKVC